MDADEKKTVERLRLSAQSIEVPESLAPDAIRDCLMTMEEGGTRVDKAARKEPKRARLARFWVPALAACMVLLLGVGMAVVLKEEKVVPSDALQKAVEPVASFDREELVVKAEEDKEGKEASATQRLAVAGSYEELYRRLDIGSGARAEAGAMAESDTTKETAADALQSSSSDGGHSSTNVRTEGVGESDIVKTDGSYLYVMQDYGEEIAIVDVRNGSMRKVSSITSEEDVFFEEFFLENDRLYVLGSAYEEPKGKKRNRGEGRIVTRLLTYDVSNPSSPVLQAEVGQEGDYQDSRLVDGYLYLFTRYYPAYNAEAHTEEEYVPAVGEGLIACEDVYLPSDVEVSSYLVISSVKADDPSRVVASKAVLSGWGSVYVSDGAVYVYESALSFSNDKDSGAIAEEDISEDGDGGAASIASNPSRGGFTNIVKLSYSAGAIEAIGEAKVEGAIDDSFSIDEYEGNTRVVTTSQSDDGEESNNVYVLDEEMKQIGSLTGIAPGELVYSARLMGDMGYFVTYRTVDPLFAVDLSDPRHPRIVGKLKLPGFSEYLHPFSEGRLLGIGLSTSEEGEVLDGVKLTMFDVTDPAKIRELDSLVLKKTWWAAPLGDYRSVYVEGDRGLVGFGTEGEEDAFLLFSYKDGEGFSEVLKDELSLCGANCVRGVRIGETLYVAGDGQATSFNLKNYKRIARIDL